MRAVMMYGAGDVRVEEVPDARIEASTDAVVRVVRTCVCGSDLHGYRSMPAAGTGAPQGHEFVGVVEEVGSDVTTVRRGDFVIAPFSFSDSTCVFCREGLQSSCVHGGWYGANGVGGAQAEAVRVPLADGSLVPVPGVDEGSELLGSLLSLSDVFSTGYHAAARGGVSADTTVTVIGDGAVGLSAVLASRLLGARRIILMGRHAARTDLGTAFGASDIVPERGEDGVGRVRELTAGEGSHVVLEAVGLMPAYEQAVGVVRPGGAISRVGLPQYEEAPIGIGSLFGRNVTLTGGVAPVRAYIERLLPAVLDGSIEPGRVFDQRYALDDAPSGYAAMDDRSVLKAMLVP